MLVSVDEMKNYLRVDFDDDDKLIESMIVSAQRTCLDIMRTDDLEKLSEAENGKIAVMYTVAYLYEHREDADHHELMITLRALLFGQREGGF